MKCYFNSSGCESAAAVNRLHRNERSSQIVGTCSHGVVVFAPLTPRTLPRAMRRDRACVCIRVEEANKERLAMQRDAER